MVVLQPAVRERPTLFRAYRGSAPTYHDSFLLITRNEQRNVQILRIANRRGTTRVSATKSIRLEVHHRTAFPPNNAPAAGRLGYTQGHGPVLGCTFGQIEERRQTAASWLEGGWAGSKIEWKPSCALQCCASQRIQKMRSPAWSRKTLNVMDDTGTAQNFCQHARRPGDESILEAVHYNSILRPLQYSNNTRHPIQIDLRSVTSLSLRSLAISNSQEARLTVTYCIAFL